MLLFFPAFLAFLGFGFGFLSLLRGCSGLCVEGVLLGCRLGVLLFFFVFVVLEARVLRGV